MRSAGALSSDMPSGRLAWAAVLTAGLSVPLHAQLTTTEVARGLDSPVAAVADPTNPETLFIVEQGGLIRVARHGVLLDEPFLDLRAAVASGGERGLLGMALAPDFAESGRFFVNFTDRSGDTVVARFRRTAETPLTADRASRFDFRWPDGRRTIDQPFANHNGGHLAFGRDGYMYIGLGDGGSGGDPRNFAQNPRSLLGKMLRLDVNVPDDDSRGYRVPDENPFVDGRPISALGEIWAFGLRNPWRYSFDDWTRGGTGALLIGDVGQDAREEIDFEPAGAGGRNYGWRLREGRQAYDSRTAPAFLPLTEPIYDYGRSVGEAVTGGGVYRGAALDPSFNGRYFFADFVSGRVWSLGLHIAADDGSASADDEREHTASLGGRSRLGSISSFGVDAHGEMLLLNYDGGVVLRVSPDFAVVPGAPQLTATAGGDQVALRWVPDEMGVVAASFDVERSRGGSVVERVTVERSEADLSWTEGDCLRVRARARSGMAGPPSEEVCR
jgi:glucose/arabinose dehydrogenase